jgi:signal transduction histidine kinase
MKTGQTSTQAQVAVELADQLYASPLRSVSNLAASVIVTAFLCYQQFSLFVALWLLWNAAVTVGRLLVTRSYRRQRQAIVDPAPWLRATTWLNAGTGVYWGVLAFLTASSADPLQTLMVTVVVLGISAQIASTMASHLPVIDAFLWPAGVLNAIGAALQGDLEHWVAAVLVLLFIGNLSRVSRHAHRAVVQTLVAKREKELSQAHLAQAQRVAAMGSTEVDLLTGFEKWSDGMYRLLGVEPGSFAVTEENILARTHAADRPLLKKARAAAFAGRKPRAGEFRIMRPDGTVRTLYCEADLLHDRTGRPMRLVFVAKDMTELRAAEQQLLESQKLEALGTLAGGVAHEINNSLVPTIALTKMVASKLPEESRERRNLMTALGGAERSRDLVKQILAFSRKDDEPRQEPMDLAAAVRDAVAMMRASIPTSIRIAERLATVPPVVGNANQITQVVVNIMTNAAQAIGAAMGTITVELALVEGEPGGAARVCLAISDTGCGMDEATRARIFEPFFTTKAVGTGTGLGLSIVHGIVTGHGGRIEVQSRVGEGARFAVCLPCAAGGMRATEAA